MIGARQPAIVINAPRAHDLEILRLPRARRRRVGEAVSEAGAVQRLLRHTVDDARRRYARHLIERRRDIDHMVELRAETAVILDAIGPGDHHRVANAAEIARRIVS